MDFILASLDIIGSYATFVPFYQEYGLDLIQFTKDIFVTYSSTFIAVDAAVTSAAMLVFIYIEGGRLKMTRLWFYPVLMFCIGLSFATPIFFYFRQAQLEKIEREIPAKVA